MANTYDWLIKGGRVIDPDQGIDAVREIGVADGKITALAESLPESGAKNVYNARGRIVTAGLVDLHTHIGWGHNHSLDPDLLAYLGGATTNCDAGTVGRLWFRGWKKFVHDACHSRALVFINANSFGMMWNDHFSLDAIDPETTGRFIREHRDVIVGVKIRLEDEPTAAPVVLAARKAKDLATIGGVPLMFQIPAGVSCQSSILPVLQAGDIITHCYAHPMHLIVNGKVLGIDTRKEAQARGVILDLGHGQAGFDFKVADAYLSAGIKPDTISSDLHGGCIWRRAFDMPTIMSKLLYLGMSLPDIIMRSTINPAKVIGLDRQIGSLRVGKIADIAVFELMEGKFEFVDGHDRNRVTAARRLRVRKTFCSGKPLPFEGEYDRSRMSWLPKKTDR
jgi:dihydroorotase